VRTLSGHFSFDGLDRAQGTRLLAAVRMVTAASHTTAPDQSPALSPKQRRDLRAVIDALPGLLTSFRADEALSDIRFAAGPASKGTIGRVGLEVAGDTAAERLNARMGIGMDEFTMASLPPDTVAFVPHHVDIKTVMTGVRTQPLMALLRAATEPDADFGALQDQAIALFGDPGTRIGIESLTFDSGPMRLTASARVVQRPNGQFGADIHVSATGVDALIGQMQGKPSVQQALPVLFMAKGMGRPEGGATVWDIAVGDGPITINGVPFGQPAGQPPGRKR
jgi:hypothetical protein